MNDSGNLLSSFRRKTCEARGEPCLRSNSDLVACLVNGTKDFVCSVRDTGRHQRCFRCDLKPGFLFAHLSAKVSMGFSARAHKPGAHGSHSDTLMAKLGVEAFREACQGKFGRDIGQEVGHRDLATDRSDIDDGSRSLLNKRWQDSVYALKSGEEVDFHCIPVRLEGLILGRTYSNDASVVDQNVEAAEPVQGGVDEV